jgi:hypothetical protein
MTEESVFYVFCHCEPLEMVKQFILYNNKKGMVINSNHLFYFIHVRIIFLILWIASSVVALLPRNDTASAMDCFLLRKFAMTKVIYKRLLCIKSVSKTIAPRNDRVEDLHEKFGYPSFL